MFERRNNRRHQRDRVVRPELTDWRGLWRRYRLYFLAAALVCLAGASILIALVGSNDQDLATSTIIRFSPVTSLRDDTGLADALAFEAALEDAAEVSTCTYCARLAKSAETFRSRALSARERMRTLVRQQDAANAGGDAAQKNVLDEKLNQAKQAAGRAFTGARLFSELTRTCGQEGFCKPVSLGMPGLLGMNDGKLDCTRDERALSDAQKHLKALAAQVSQHARTCQQAACPSLVCDRAHELQDDLALAGEAVTLIGAHFVTPGLSDVQTQRGQGLLESERPGFEIVESELAGLQTLLLNGFDAPSDLADMIARLTRIEAGIARMVAHLDRPWGTGGPSPTGLGEGLWRFRLVALDVKTMLDEARVSDERRDRGGAPGPMLSLTLLPSYTNAMLNMARLGAVLQPPPPEPRPLLVDSAANDIQRCALSGWGRTAVQLAEAKAALSVCMARSGCAQAPSPAKETRIDSAIAALATLTDRARFNAERARFAATGKQGGVRLTTPYAAYQVGEVIAVNTEMTDAMCMADGGAILLRNTKTDDVLTRYRLNEPPKTALLFEAPEPAGKYRIEAHAPGKRGGQRISALNLVIDRPHPGCQGFNGTWSTGFGTLRMVERNGEITGTYKRSPDARPGYLFATRKGRTLTGRWLSEIGTGGTRLVLLKDGKGFKGSWSHYPDKVSGTGVWNGRCAKP